MTCALEIRKSRADDMPRMLEIYDCARDFMRLHGNATQWVGGYPSAGLLLDDISRGVSYVVVSGNRVVGTFAFIVGEDPTYLDIDGAWLNDDVYGTIHRLASDGSVSGVADACLEFCRGKVANIRVDTHDDNMVMLNWIKRSGFEYCGVIHVADGTPRRAFQLASP